MKHFLAISDLSSGDMRDLLDPAIKLKEEYFKKGEPARHARGWVVEVLEEGENGGGWVAPCLMR